MTNKEAIEELKPLTKLRVENDIGTFPMVYTSAQVEALNMAIKALEERPTGEWILERIYYDNYHMIDNNIFYCSICGRRVTTTASKATVAVVYPFCHGCGTKMEEKSE